jgi:dipeptidyl aminopeptidase/acylaminoacyl peptidase
VIAALNHPYGEITLIGPGRSPGTVVVDKAVPEEWSLADGAHKPLDADRVVDCCILDPTTRRALGVWSEGDDPRQFFFDPTLKARQAAFTRALGGAPIISSWSADFRRLVLYTNRGSDAGTYWLFDGKGVQPFGYAYPELPDANVGPTQIIAYKAADGLELHGVLTLPPGREAKALPLVVLPHGGPQEHDTLRFDWMAQAFAGHGYAVFQPNFRGSSGYGVEFRDAGFGQWGRKMQTDISDGVAELARQGVVDPKRACIVGASYGGYAALAGVTVQQGFYRCAVSYAGLSDLNYLLNEELGDDRNAGSRYIRKFIGAEAHSYADAVKDISPARLAARADAPILLIHGKDDSVVPIGQSREMERVLRGAGKSVEFIELKGEDHWLSRDATRKAMLAAALSFVERHNPAD